MIDARAVELVVVLFAVVLLLATIGQRLAVPFPILLVLGGLVLALVPGLPPLRLHPDLVFFVFLPPILWAAAYFTSLRDFRANLRPITLLALGLVCATTAAVAVVARAVVPGLAWAGAVALGAIVSPPDAVAAVAILRRLRLPHRLVVILEGESLVNDATALVLYRAAVAAIVTGVFSLEQVAGEFVAAAVGGTLIGLAVAGVAVLVLRSTTDSLVEIAITLLAPYIAWILADRAHTSAVLACVAGGLLLRRYFSLVVAPATRLQARAVWDLLLFALNGVIFILIGLQLRTLFQSMGTRMSVGTLAVQGLIVSAAAILTRIVWVPIAAAVPRLVPSIRRRDPLPSWRSLAVLSWTSMRGIVSLAAALALPLTTASGAPLPHREEIIVLTFVVILVTLVVQGLSLGPLIRWLRLPEDRTLEEERLQAEEHALRAALDRLATLQREPWAANEQVEDLRRHYEERAQLVAERRAGAPPASSLAEAAFKRARHETLAAERQVLLELRDRGVISDDVLLVLERELDVEAARHGLAGYGGPDGAVHG
ncbi:MAG TPA: Na+/H+ antiporter [Gemmatimonadales bacterium]|nr:Na+/H+ antiporter [Gemmatimonadales bacterium]